MKPGHLLLSFCLLLIPVGSAAQRLDYRPLEDSLRALVDVPRLYRMEAALERPAAAASLDPIVRRGLIGLRLWELTHDRDDARRALGTFETGARRFPAEPWGHYGVALALARGPDVRLPLPGSVTDGIVLGQSVAEILGRDPKSRARRAARRALEADPAFAPAAVLLGDLAVADGGRSRDLIREARDALAAVRAGGGATPQSDRALADMEIALGNYDAAGEAAAAAGADAGALRARAVALLLQPAASARGAELYWQGVALLDAAAAAQYYADLQVIATPREEAEWRVAGAGGRGVWLERFWDRRAAEAGVTVAERLAEHYRRLTLARSRYLRNSVRGADGVGVLLADEQNRYPFDDRGLVLIRHGEPFAIVRTSGRGLLPNESWAYQLPEQGRQLFHFAALRGSQSFHLISDLLQALDPRAMVYIDERDRAVLALVTDRAHVEPRYQGILARLQRALSQSGDLRGTEVRSVLESVDADYRRGARTALRTDSHVPGFTGELAFHHDVFSFRTPFERTDLTAAFAIPAGQLEPLAGSGGASYAVRVSVILHDTLQDVVTRRDTAQRVRRQPRDDHLRLHVTLPVVPSEHTVYRLVAVDEVGGRGRVVSGGSVLRDYRGTDLMLSDVVLALPDSAGDWVRGDTRLALALPRSFAPERPFTVFYEVYHLRPDAPYSTRIVVEPVERTGLGGRIRGLFGGGPDRIDLRFDDVARPGPDALLQESRRVASDLPAGSYRMVVTVASEGRTARTETLFSVIR
jgi:hypothetical protein